MTSRAKVRPKAGLILDERRRQIRAWCLYDWANSAFATTVMAALYPPFFRSLATQAGLEPHRATAYWGYFAAAAMILVSVTAPVLGAAADHSGHRKRFLAGFAGLGVLSTTAFLLNGDDTWALAGFLFVLANVGFAGANVFYEALLPSVAPPGRMDRVSAQGYALGYLGGGLLLVVNAAWVMRPEWFGFDGPGVAVKASFVSVAVWWAVFTIPLLRRVPEPAPGRSLGDLQRPLAAGFRRLASTFRQLQRYRQLLLFLAAFWIYNDGISTIIKMATAYGDEIGIGVPHLVGALVLTQFVGFPCALLFGELGDRVGAKRGILLALVVYAGISIGGFFMTTPLHFYVLAGLVGTVQGGSQALSRSLFASMLPAGRTAEFFGFYGASSKFAGIFGPLVFGVVSQLTGTGRMGILVLVAFFVVGGGLLALVDVEKGRAAARDAGAG